MESLRSVLGPILLMQQYKSRKQGMLISMLKICFREIFVSMLVLIENRNVFPKYFLYSKTSFVLLSLKSSSRYVQERRIQRSMLDEILSVLE